MSHKSQQAHAESDKTDSISDLLEKIRCEQKVRNFTTAERFLKQALALRPRHPQALSLRIELARQQDKLTEAIAHAQSALGIYPNHPRILLEAARVYAFANEPDNVHELLDRFPQGLPHDVAKANLLLKIGAFQKANALSRDILKRDPKNRTAHLTQISVANAAGDFERALTLAEHACMARPKDGHLIHQHTKIIRSLGRPADARKYLLSIIRRFPRNAILHLQLGDISFDLGRHGAAARHYRAAQRLKPDLKAAQTGKIKNTLALGNIAEAEQIAKTVLKHSSNSADTVIFPLTNALRKQGKTQEACTLLEAELEKKPANLRLRTRLVEIYDHIGETRKANAHETVIQASNPEFGPLHITIINRLIQQNEFQAALKHIEHTLSSKPNNIEVLLQKLRVLENIGDTLSAIQLVRRLRRGWPSHVRILVAIAKFYKANEKLQAARKMIDRARQQNSNHQQAYLTQLSIFAAMEGQKAVADIICDRISVMQQQENSSASDALTLLRSLHIISDAEFQPIREAVLQLLENHIGAFSERETFEFLNQAEQHQLHAIAQKALQAILDNGPHTPNIALSLFRKFLANETADKMDLIAIRLQKYIPAAHKHALLANFTLLQHGPDAAIENMRDQRASRRTKREARKLGQFLLSAGKFKLGIRYLRFCRQRWHDDFGILSIYAKTLIDAGFPQAATKALNGSVITSRHQRQHLKQLRAQALIHAEQPKAALSELSQVKKTASRSAANSQLLILLALGRLQEATQVISEARAHGYSGWIGSGHFSISLAGCILNDLALYHQEITRCSNGETAPEDLETRYIYAARQLINTAANKSRNTTITIRNAIPHKVFQYWDKKSPPPGVSRMMSSWANQKTIDYTLFDRGAALRFLKDTYGNIYAKAFTLANHVAEESDFLRLCYLQKFGGIYADTDDRLIGNINNLLPSDTDLLCFREPHGAISNNIIAAAPEHPAIKLAAEMAANALILRDNDNTWSKTGPGLLTRSIATYINHCRKNDRDAQVRIEPVFILRRDVQIHAPLPYKRTQTYWNQTEESYKYRQMSMTKLN